MENKNRFFILCADIVIGVLMIAAVLTMSDELALYIKIIACVCVVALTAVTAVASLAGKESLMKSAFVLDLIALVLIACFFAFDRLGLLDDLSDMEKVRELILSAGSWGYAVFALVLVLNTVILPLPSAMMYFAGVAVYGPVATFFIATASVLVGSFIDFFIGRFFGSKVVVWCVGRANTEKYRGMLGKKGNLLFAIMQLLPFFPDDILCMVAGLSDMSFFFFAAVMVLIRPLYIAAVCFLGTGTIIPFSGWGIPVWIAIFVILAVMFVLYCRYQTRIEAFLKRRFAGRKDKNAK